MTDIKQRQEEFRELSADQYSGGDSLFSGAHKVGFDTFRESPLFIAMKEALEFYANYKTLGIPGPITITRDELDRVIVEPSGKAEVHVISEKAREVLKTLEEMK